MLTTLFASDTVTSTFGSGDVLLWMLEFFLFVIWFWLLIAIFSDLFRDKTTGGGVKALWVFFLILLPFLGILFYLIFRGRGMGERGVAQAAAAQEQFNSQIRSAAASAESPADQIAKAKALLDSGAITQAEFDQLKAAALA
ncbi:SHOCT domain-containing protein [Cellulomonas sp. McL0617]|uniref:SHOCT domain-containing protein n=1 Tax=Cellulomonas sp. McL0617 TaxID=3415675 RepID=UPI003CED405C